MARRSPADPGALSPERPTVNQSAKAIANVTGSFLLNFLHHQFGLSSIFSLIFSGGQTALHCTRQHTQRERERERETGNIITKQKAQPKKADRLTGVCVRAARA